MKQTCRIVVVGLLLSIVSAGSALACGDPPPSTVLRAIIITLGPPIRITLIFDPWTTFSSSVGQNCVCAFRFPTALIDSVDQVRLVETGTNNLVPGFSPWDPNVTTSSAVEMMLGAGSGNAWFGFLNSLSGDVPGGIQADFQVDVTLSLEVMVSASLEGAVDDLLAEFQADPSSRVFTDEGDETGQPLLVHAGFVDVVVPVFEDGFESGDTSAWDAVAGK